MNVNNDILDFPEIAYRGGSKPKGPNNRWRLDGVRAVQSSISDLQQSDEWSFIEIQDSRARGSPDSYYTGFVSAFESALASFGIPGLRVQQDSTNFHDWHRLRVNLHRPSLQDINNAIQSIYERFIDPKLRRVRFWVVLLPEKTMEWYQHIKRVADLQVGVPTVCMVKKPDVTKIAQQLSNIATKLNLKLSNTNANHCLVKPCALLQASTMVVGIDVVSKS